jgi:alpha-D-ribose 1-methylphosphonate 5-triphosphate synthase subunit PhnL
MAKRPTLIQASRNVAPSEKAAFHQVTGAGKSHVLRKFFGLSASDEAVIIDRIGDALDAAVKKTR